MSTVKCKTFKIIVGETMRKYETRFEELRKDKELKQKDIADVLEVLEDRYSKWERGIDDISLIKVNKLANFHNVSIDYLLGLSDLNIKTPKKDIDFKILPQRLLQIRKEANLTQSELSEKVGFSQRTYSDYERGKFAPTTSKLCYIAMYYNISFDYLVGRTDNKKLK